MPVEQRDPDDIAAARDELEQRTANAPRWMRIAADVLYETRKNKAVTRLHLLDVIYSIWKDEGAKP